jgi:FtsZ-binding cell division protein ZapB
MLQMEIVKLQEEVRSLRRENIELTSECNDLSSANIMAKAGHDYYRD